MPNLNFDYVEETLKNGEMFDINANFVIFLGKKWGNVAGGIGQVAVSIFGNGISLSVLKGS